VSTSSELTIQLPKGVALHARPAGSFVKVAMAFLSTIRVRAGDREANAKSILEVMALGAEGGSEISLRADGDDADAALGAIREWSDALERAS
jgi:phosphotransferase system HPr (HPr) family protein